MKDIIFQLRDEYPEDFKNLILKLFPKNINQQIYKSLLTSDNINNARKIFHKKIHDTLNPYRGLNRLKEIKQLFGEIKFTANNYLDIGCGSGEITKVIGTSSLSRKYYGVDLIKTFDPNEKNYINTKVYYEGNHIPFPDNYFDFITLLHVIHHVPNIDGFIKEMTRVLKPGGYLVLREHNIENEKDKLLIDAEHYIFATIMTKKPEKNYSNFMWFNNKDFWRKKLYNFTSINSFDLYNIDKTYLELFQKK